MANRILNKKEAKRIKASNLPRIKVLDDFILDAEQIAIGAYKPLKGFMCRDDFKEVVYNMRLADGGVWTIPIYLAIDERESKAVSKGDKIILCDMDGFNIALLKVKDIFSFPKATWCEKVFGTNSREHPGVNRVYNMHCKLIGGDIELINRARFKFHRYNLDPSQVKKIIRERGWKIVTGFQTRNVPHRAHEYLQKLALSVTDGLLIHPIIGWKKQGDFSPEVIIHAYKSLIRNYYLKDSVIFSGLATAMRYAGPREAVFHAIIRKNYGCSHFVVGRDHAGVGDFYGKYDAHAIFDKIPEIGITPLLFDGPFHCRRCNVTVNEKICPHPDKDRISISGTRIRGLVSTGKGVGSELVRPEVARILKSYGKKAFI